MELSKIIVLKIGSSSVVGEDQTVRLVIMTKLVETICMLRKQQYHVVLVTSGAVSMGCARMELKERPKDLVNKQAVAAIGQSRLMRLYDDLFSLVSQPIAQVLLTRDNLSKAYHYQNALNTIKQLLCLGVVPIINENDTVAVEELKVGDNDTLSALIASLIQADWLFLLTDVDALYNKDPVKYSDAKAISIVKNIDELDIELGNGGKMWGTGGIKTKIQAAKIATAAGIRTVICNANNPGNIISIVNNNNTLVGAGTQFLPQKKPLSGRKKWIAHGFVPSGKIYVDSGATSAIKDHKSLFGAGIIKIEGEFSAHYNVGIYNQHNEEFARGIINYNSNELSQIKGLHSKDYYSILGYISTDEVINRDNLALL